MQYLSADCILPVTGKPCYNSVLAIEDDGTVEGIFEKSKLEGSFYEIRYFRGILCPGFINTHCHLELSWAKGLISEGKGLDDFVRQLEEFRKSVSKNNINKAIETAALQMQQSGIIATVDIANDEHTIEYKSKNQHYFQTLVEVFGSNPTFAGLIFEKALSLKKQFEAETQHGRTSIVPHATYSLSEELFRKVVTVGNNILLSLHHQENEDENLFFLNGSGPIAERRATFNPGLSKYSGTGNRPMESISDYFNPDQKLLLVHNTVTTEQDIEFILNYFNHVFWCLCPNANLYIEHKLPDVRLLRSRGCIITLGTDSLASNQQLSILEEIKTIQKHFPEIPFTELVYWGTMNGAEFIGEENLLGSFEKGKKPGVVLIENVDIESLMLKPESTSRLIIPSGI